MNPMENQLEQVLRDAGARLKWSALLAGLCWWLAVCLGLWLALLALDNLLSLPAGLRLPLALGGAAFSAFHLFRKVLRPAWRRPSPERTALMLEQRYGIGENLLINAVQFQRAPLPPTELAFADKTIEVSGELAGRVRFHDLWDWRRLRVWGAAAAGVLVLWIGFVTFFPRQFAASTQRYVRPLADTPPPGRCVLKLTPGGDVVVPEGGGFDVALEVDTPGHAPLAKPPVLVWQERADFVQPLQSAGENLPLTPRDNKYYHTFANLQAPFAFRVFAGDAYTRSVQVRVLARPVLKAARFRVTPPAYTGRPAQTVAGPPATLSALPGSEVQVTFQAQPPIGAATWSQADKTLEFKRGGEEWTATTTLTGAGPYQISAPGGADTNEMILVRGEATLLPDNPPEVDFVTTDRNRVVQYGQTLSVAVAARDDFGLSQVYVTVRPADKDTAVTLVKKWTYLGPPGNPGPVNETLALPIDSRIFESGVTYYLEAAAGDFRPGGAPAQSRPIVLRVKSADDLAPAEGDPLAPAFAELKRAVAAQEKAVRLASNLKTYLEEVLAKQTVGSQASGIGEEQYQAAAHGRQAVALFDQHDEGRNFGQTLSALVDQDMSRVQNDLSALGTAAPAALPTRVAAVEAQQERILAALLNLLGQVTDDHADPLKTVAEGAEIKSPPAELKDQEKQLLEETKDFVSEQERLLEKSRTLADKGPEDLTQAETDNLGEMSREEEKWAKYFEDKLNDFSKLPQQDFADSSLAQELNSVYQELAAATNALAQKKVSLAVPEEQNGLENAQKMENNLERWMATQPDNIKWSLEEPPEPADIAVAELPKELEDIVGELLDKEDEMKADVEDVTSSWLDSLDKGAGWSAGDGPISDMSAKGITGNLLPNQNEVGGRSGEGRNGRSHGQMVSDTAEGKGGRETPTRLDPEPFEQGSVKDSDTSDHGGATGGGKLSGFAGEGLRGPTAPGSSQKMPRLAEQQAKIRQQAESLALQLRKYHVSSGELESSVGAMQQLEAAARKNDGLGVRRAYSEALGTLTQARRTVDQQATVRREQDKVPPWMREEIRIGVQDGIPKGYEELAGEYFRAMAEGPAK